MIAQIHNSHGGVKTPEGKQISKYNAVRHGVLKNVLTDDEAITSNQVEVQLVEDYQPKTFIEKLLIEKMSIALARLQRAINAEREFVLEIVNPPVYENDVWAGLTKGTLVKHGHKAWISDMQIDTIEKTYARYITTCERQFYRALHELQRVQAVRKGMKPHSIAVDFMGESRSGD